MKKRKDINRIDIFIFFLLWCIYTVAMLFLFHRQSVNYAGQYLSDIVPYIFHMQGVDTGYDYPYPVMFWLGKVFDIVLAPEMAMAFSVTALNSLTPIALKYYSYRLWESRIENRSVGKTVYFNLLLFAGLLVSMLILPGKEAGVDFRYVGIFTPNPYHNATYLASRGFAVVSFFAFMELLKDFDHPNQAKEKRRNYLIFSISLLLTTMTKPSFTLGFVATSGIFLLIRWIKDGLKAWRSYLRVGLCFLPTFVDLLYQYMGLFTGSNAVGQEKGIGLGFLTAWTTVTDNVILALVLGLSFPIIVLLCSIRNLKDCLAYRFSWYMLAVNLFMFVFLYEKGFRMRHLNFAWGYMFGMFFVTIMSIQVLLDKTLKKKQKLPALILQWSIFTLHIICGIIYFAEIMRGVSFI